MDRLRPLLTLVVCCLSVQSCCTMPPPVVLPTKVERNWPVPPVDLSTPLPPFDYRLLSGPLPKTTSPAASPSTPVLPK